MFRLFGTLIFGLALLIFAINAYAQGTNSPYSRIGVGDVMRPMNINSVAMGGLGLSMSNLNNINLMNPAAMPLNRYTSFEAAAFAEQKNLNAPNNSQRDFGGNLGYMALQMPVSRFSSMVIGLQPYSLVKYETSSFARIANAPSFVRYNYIGSGGMTQAFLAYGSKVWKEFYLGGRVNYNFGASRNLSQSTIFDSNDPAGEYMIEVIDRINYSDFSFQTGAFYRLMLDEKKTKSINFGATYDLAANLKASSMRSFARKTISGSTVSEDTIHIDKSENVNIPAGVGLGISYQKALHYGFGIDIFTQDWSTYERNGQSSANLGKLLKVSVGGEWTPNVASVDGYFNRVTYRGGFAYSSLPIIVNGNNLTDMNVNFGMNMPFGRYFSTFNIALTAGIKRGADETTLKENYFRLHIGATVNDRWFVRRRYD